MKTSNKDHQIDINELEPYKIADYYLIPLHKYDKVTRNPFTKKSIPRGKTPIDRDWRKKKYTKAQIESHIESDRNIGVRLRKTDLVLDVDPRNFPDDDDVLQRFCSDLRIDLSIFPRVETGSGGSHFYMLKPADVSVRDSLEDYPGLEFKAYGRQVVAAGSVHPNGGRYFWDCFYPDLDRIPEVPAPMLKIIKKAATNHTQTEGGGEHTPEEIEKMLECLDPREYSDNESWLQFMMAVHHASGGEARQEFINWSISDRKYKDDAWVIGQRWDSLSTTNSRSELITFRTLHKALAERGYADKIPQPSVVDDFKDIDETYDPKEKGIPEHERKSSLEKMNDQFWLVDEGQGVMKVYAEATDPGFTPARKFWKRYTPYNFGVKLGNKRVQKNKSNMPLAEAWLRWPKRREVEGLVFDPERDHPGFLNLWRGWGVEPKKGKWDLLQELLFEVLCDGDDEAYDYVMNWSADMIQHPGSTAEVALCFQGAKGTGKGTFGRALATLAGRHGLHISSPEHLTGRFNSHLRDCICLFADEAVAPYDNAANSRLKALITEPSIPIEGKGQDLITVKNLVHIIMASNDEWFVPMTLSDERRFFVTKVNTHRQGDKAFFHKLHRQMDNGGYSAMLWDLLNHDLGEWRPRTFIPMTVASVDQKVRSLNPLQQWWFNILEEGVLPFECKGDWEDTFTVYAAKDDVKDSFASWCITNRLNPGGRGRSNTAFFGKELQALCGEDFKANTKLKFTIETRLPAFGFPPLADCRREFERLLGTKYAWNIGDLSPAERYG